MRCRTVCTRITARDRAHSPAHPAATRCPPRHEHLPADRRVRVPLRLRGEHARRSRRLGRVAVPPPAGLAERLRRAARPRRRACSASGRRTRWCRTPAGTSPGRWCSRPPGTPPTGWLTVKDMLVMGPPDIGHRRADVPARARRRGRAGNAAAHRDLLRRPGRDRHRTACRCSTTARTTGDVELRRRRLRPAASVQSGDLELEMESSLALGILGARSYGRTTLEHGESAFVVARPGAGTGRTNVDEAHGAARRRPRTSGASG